MIDAMTTEHTSIRNEITPSAEDLFVCGECEAEVTVCTMLYETTIGSGETVITGSNLEPCGHQAPLVHYPRPLPSSETRDALRANADA